MTEPTTTPEAVTEPTGDNPPAEPQKPALSNAEAAELRVLRKKLADVEKAEKARQEAEMTELQKAQARLAEYEAKAAALERENQITKIASKAGLPAELWTRVQGSSAEEIEADVATLLGFVKAQPPAPAHTGQAPNNPPAPAPQSPKAEWARLKATDPVAAAAYYAKHRDSIIKE